MLAGAMEAARIPRLVQAVLPVLLLTGAAPAQLADGSAAPELPAPTWVGEPPAASLAELRGRVVVLWFFHPDTAGVSDDLPLVRRVWRRYRREGLVLLGCTPAGPTEVAAWRKRKEVDWPVAAACKARELYEAPDNFLFVLDHAGRILWHGFAGDDAWVAQLPAALREAEKARDRWDPGERIPELAEAVDACRRQRFGQAWKLAEKALRAHRDEAGIRDAVQAFLDDLRAEGARRLAEADAMAAEGRYEEATVFLERQAGFFRGGEPGDAMQQRLKEWRRDREARKLRKLDQRRLEALATIYERGNPGKGLQLLRELLEEARGTPLEAVLRRNLAECDG